MEQLYTGGELLVESLKCFDVDTVFGIPGIQLYELVDALYDSQGDIDLVLPKHEQSTTYMADGYARVTGKPGVAMVVPGPGMLNATAGLATAYACSSPVLLISGQIHSSLMNEKEYGALHEIPDQTGVLEKLTKWVGVARDASDIPDLVGLAFYHMLTGVPGPVALEIPPDVLAQKVPFRAPTRFSTPEQRVETVDLERISTLISESKHPYLLVGGGAIHPNGGEKLLELAEKLHCPIIQTRNGRGALDTSHPLVLSPHVRSQILEHADLVIAFGTRLGTGAGKHIELGAEKIININAEPEHMVFPRPHSDVALVADVHTAARQIVEHLTQSPDSYESEWSSEQLQRIQELSVQKFSDIQPQMEYLEAIKTSLPRDTVLVSEYTQVGYVASISYPVEEPATFVSPGYQGTLGYGFATAIGAQVGSEKSRVVSVTGDGGFAWTMPELATLKRYNIPLITVVFNDGRYGNVYRSQKYQYENRVYGSELTNPDFRQLASAHGIEFARVDSASGLREVLQNLKQQEPIPVLIEVEVDEFPSPWHHFDEPGQ